MLTDIERKNIIQEIVKTEPEPDQKLCPTLMIYYPKVINKEKAYIIKNINTGEIDESPKCLSVNTRYGHTYVDIDWKKVRKNNVILRSPCKIVEAEYAKVHTFDSHKVLELAVIKIEANKKGEGRPWNFQMKDWYGIYNRRFFVFDDTTRVFLDDGTEFMPGSMNKFYNTYFVRNICRYNCRINNAANKQRYLFTVGLGGLNVNSYVSDSSMYMWSFIDWYKKFGHACIGQGGKSKETLSAEEVMKKMEDLDIPTLCALYPMYEYYRAELDYGNYRSIGIKHSTLAIFNVVDDWGIFRIIKRSPEYNYYRLRGEPLLQHVADIAPATESARLLISPKGKIVTFISMGGTWMRTSRTSYNFFTWGERDVTIVGSENLEKVEHLKYLKGVLKEDDGAESIKKIMNCLRYPMIEQLAKMKLDYLVDEICRNGQIPSTFYDCFGVKPKKGSITKIVGMTSAQLSKFNQLLWETKNTTYGNWAFARWFIRSVKAVTGVKNLSDLSKEDTEKWFPRVAAMVNELGLYWKSDLVVEENNIPRYRHQHQRSMDSEEYLAMSEEDIRKIRRVVKVCDTNGQTYKLYSDMINTYASLSNDNKPNINLYDIDDSEHLRIIHDNLVALLNHQHQEEYAERNRQQCENYKKRYDKLKKKFFAEDDEFVITPPLNAADVVSEGSNLHHCVGGYVDSIASGRTNILFLRKKETPDTSFYTIEVSNNDECRQIHGVNNCWLGNNPEAIPFVVKWLRERKISYTKDILLETAVGYCASGVLLDAKQFGL